LVFFPENPALTCRRRIQDLFIHSDAGSKEKGIDRISSLIFMICTGQSCTASFAQQQSQSGTTPSARSPLNLKSSTTSENKSQWFWSNSSGQVFQHAPQLTQAMRSILTFIRLFRTMVKSDWWYWDKGLCTDFYHFACPYPGIPSGSIPPAHPPKARGILPEEIILPGISSGELLARHDPGNFD